MEDNLTMIPFVKETLQHKIDVAIKLIRSIPAEEIEVAYSGGKDSDVILELVKMSGKKYKAVYKQTTVDPPLTTAYVKSKGAVVLHPKTTFFKLIEKRGMPTRFRRFCCAELKEYYTSKYVVLGVRRAESIKRAKRYVEPEECRNFGKNKKAKQYYPILYWSNEDVLKFIETHKIKLHPLYYREDGSIDINRRLGCMCCPLQSKKKLLADYRQHPRIVKATIKALSVFMQTKTDSAVLLHNANAYELFASYVFYDSLDSYLTAKRSVGDYRKALEAYFKIDLTI
jgi:phosphoadenosine phosphosulfate reductase